jgi:hypothetical protein
MEAIELSRNISGDTVFRQLLDPVSFPSECVHKDPCWLFGDLYVQPQCGGGGGVCGVRRCVVGVVRSSQNDTKSRRE